MIVQPKVTITKNVEDAQKAINRIDSEVIPTSTPKSAMMTIESCNRGNTA